MSTLFSESTLPGVLYPHDKVMPLYQFRDCAKFKYSSFELNSLSVHLIVFALKWISNAAKVINSVAKSILLF